MLKHLKYYYSSNYLFVLASVIHKLTYGLFDFCMYIRSQYRWIRNKYVPLLPSHLGPKNQLPGLSFNALLLKYVYILFLLVYTKIVDLKIQNRK